MLTTAPTYDRTALRRWYLENRNRSAEIFSLVDPAAHYERPIALRLPVIFYEGHLPAFSVNKLVREALGRGPVDAELDLLFNRGIDPDSAADAAKLGNNPWPSRRAVEEYGAACDAAVLDALANGELDDAERSPLLRRAQAAYTILEHEEMHHETFLYMLHRMPFAQKRADGHASDFFEREALENGRATVAAGTATLGANRDDVRFGWDNEFEQRTVDVAAFEIDRNDVTNGDWLRFVRDGGPLPPFWLERDGAYKLLAQFGELPLPLTWPVYVTLDQANAYATWRGTRLPTEAEYHRAAFGTPEGAERDFPWGNEPPDAAKHGNFDFRRFDPEPAGIHAGGKSAWGVYDLAGNGWEWTTTEFAPFAGFEAMASYPEYSADFFDGKHFVVKGASPVTSRNLVRRSFRNWYRPDYPFVYATFRTADA